MFSCSFFIIFVNMSKMDKHIEDFRKKHGFEFDYSKAVYVNWNTKIEIICPKHGSFFQTIAHHKKGTKCPKCNSKQKLTFERFLEKANKIWEGKYTYYESSYKGSQSTVIANCKLHGDFTVNVQKHLAKNPQGCSKCKPSRYKKNEEKVIKRFIEVHGHKFQYGEYKGMKNKMEIICPEHGSFFQTPSNHLRSKDCPKCVLEKQKETNSKSLTQFIKESIEIHGDKYDYSKFLYVNNKTKGIIICPEHGEFLQSPQSHAYFGNSCPKCANKVSKSELEISKYLNNLNVKNTLNH